MNDSLDLVVDSNVAAGDAPLIRVPAPPLARPKAAAERVVISLPWTGDSVGNGLLRRMEFRRVAAESMDIPSMPWVLAETKSAVEEEEEGVLIEDVDDWREREGRLRWDALRVDDKEREDTG